MTSRNTKPVTGAEARRLLADGHVNACAVCRAYSELGILEEDNNGPLRDPESRPLPAAGVVFW
ncbi:DUF6233 domain-containing protein [Streptomyces sp. NPDC058084]|uniref:DUF6233 domain-containing protein n=1 Tax=Streptomyces sp. NPDC058084 TaxID=3346333 RepID=UPI0036E770B4